MPIYEYQCQACNEIVEAWQNLSDEPLTKCPSCAGELKKLISMSSFQLKGGGWYADGYSSSAPKNGKACSAETPCAAAQSSSPSADKPAAGCPKKDNSACKCA